jgi:excinuclease ABC subunit A
LIKGILYPALRKQLGHFSDKTGEHTRIAGDYHLCGDIEYVDQNPIGKSSRSNPATYIKAFDEIRKLYADQKHAKANGYKPSHFSFNVPGGRCEMCQGEGEITVEMQFMADVHLVCEACNGKRFKEEILEVKYRDKNIFDILEMPVSEAVEFFHAGSGRTEKKIVISCKIISMLAWVCSFRTVVEHAQRWRKPKNKTCKFFKHGKDVAFDFCF